MPLEPLLLPFVAITSTISLVGIIVLLRAKTSPNAAMRHLRGGGNTDMEPPMQIEPRRPRRRGSIYIPPDEAEEARQRIIEENARQGRDTPIRELRD